MEPFNNQFFLKTAEFLLLIFFGQTYNGKLCSTSSVLPFSNIFTGSYTKPFRDEHIHIEYVTQIIVSWKKLSVSHLLILFFPISFAFSKNVPVNTA